MKQRILVIGGAHTVGAKVTAALIASDWATPVAAAASTALTAKTLDGIDAVFNGTTGSPQRILGTARALQSALQRSSTMRLVHLSSMTVYGDARGETLESAPLRSDAGAYGAAQVAAEALVAGHSNTVVLRPGCEYGPGCVPWSERIARLLCSRRLGDLGAHGDGICNLLFVDDLVVGIVSSLRAAHIEGNSFNLAMRAPPTWNEYLSLYARSLCAVPLSRLGARRLKLETKLLAPPLKVLESLGSRLPVLSRMVAPAITPSLLALCGQDIRLNSEKAERLLKLEWTPLPRGLELAAAAYRGRPPSDGSGRR